MENIKFANLTQIRNKLSDTRKQLDFIEELTESIFEDKDIMEIYTCEDWNFFKVENEEQIYEYMKLEGAGKPCKNLKIIIRRDNISYYKKYFENIISVLQGIKLCPLTYYSEYSIKEYENVKKDYSWIHEIVEIVRTNIDFRKFKKSESYQCHVDFISEMYNRNIEKISEIVLEVYIPLEDLFIVENKEKIINTFEELV